MRPVLYSLFNLLTIIIFISSLACPEKQAKAEPASTTDTKSNPSSRKAGVREGNYKTYYPNGNIKEEMFFVDGKLHGVFRKYDQDGTLIEEMNFKDGKLNGTLKRYYVNGEYIIEEVFNDGNFISGRWVENVEPAPKNVKKAKSKNEDTIDLSTTELKYLGYFTKLKRQIESEWVYPEESRYRWEQGILTLKFTIDKKGALKGIQILESTGYNRLDKAAIQSINAATPFDPFPEDWGGLDKLNIKATFIYNIPETVKDKPFSNIK